MKKKWLIAFVAGACSVTVALGIAACGVTKAGKSDDEIAQSAINTLNSLYMKDGKVKTYETPDDYPVLAQVQVDGKPYAVEWTPNVTTAAYAENVKIGAKDGNNYTIEITRATVDIEYTLTASVTAGKAVKTASYNHKIPAKSSEDSTTASISFASLTNRTEYSTDIQVWENTAGTLVFTNKKANSITDVFATADPVRIYQGSTVEIEFPGITKVVFHSETNQPDSFEKPKAFYDDLKTNLESSFPDATVIGDDENATVTLTLSSPSNFIYFIASKQLRFVSIDVEGIEGGATDVQKVAAVKAWLTIPQTSFNLKTNLSLTTEKAGTTIAWSLKTTSEYAKVENGTLKIETLPASGEAKVTLVATISAGTSKDTKEFVLTLTPEATLENDGTAEQPYTVAEVFALASTLESGKVYQVEGKSVSMHVKGIVTDGGKWESEHSNWQDVMIADAASSQKKLKLYGLNPGAGLTQTNPPAVGGTIVVVGALKNYNGEIELTFDGSINLNTVEYTAPQGGTVTPDPDVPSGTFTPITAPTPGTYYMGMNVEGTVYYLTGVKDSYYLGTSATPTEAGKVTLATSGDGYTLKVGSQFIVMTVSGTHVNADFAATSSQVWTWDETHKTFTWTISGEAAGTYYLGTYWKSGNQTPYTTVGTSKIENFGNSKQYCALLGAFAAAPELTDEQKAQKALDALNIPAELTEDFTMPESTVAGVALKFTNSTNTAVIAVAEGGGSVNSHPSRGCRCFRHDHRHRHDQ